MKKFIISLVAILAFALILQSTFAQSPPESDYYSDVSSGDRYFEAIEFVSDEGIVNGYDDGTYGAEILLNRAELLKILIEAKYDDEFESYANADCFNDVPAGEWFVQYVCFAKDEGIIEGYGDGTFKPGANISLVEAMKIVLEIFDYDYLESEPWYEDLIYVASDKNFIPLDFVSFDQFVERGQMADMITRVLKSESGELSEYLGNWEPFVVTYENLTTGAITELSYCANDFGYYLEGDGYSPSNDCNSCTCQADGTFSCEEEVCGEGLLNQTCEILYYEQGEIFTCNEEKKELYGCDWGSEANYGDHDLVRCGMWDTVEEDVLVYVGGRNNMGYNLIGEVMAEEIVEEVVEEEEVVVEREFVIISSVDELYEFWGEIDSEESAKNFAMAATLFVEAFSEDEIRDIYGEDFEFLQDVELNFSNVTQDDSIYEVPLYHSPSIGCSPFPVFELIYSVSNDELIEISSDQIGEIESGYCVGQSE